MNLDELCRQSIEEAARLLAAKEIRSVELTEAELARIARLDVEREM